MNLDHLVPELVFDGWRSISNCSERFYVPELKGDELKCIELLKNRNLHNHRYTEAGLVKDGRKEYRKTYEPTYSRNYLTTLTGRR